MIRKFTWVRMYQKKCVCTCTSIQRFGKIRDKFIYICVLEPVSIRKCRKFKTGIFFLCVCSIFDPKFLQIHLMPDRQRKPLRCERYRDNPSSDGDECHRRALEKKNISIAWKYGSALMFMFSFCGCFVWFSFMVGGWVWVW